MTFLQFLGYFLLVDAILSLVTFGVLYFFRKDLLLRLRSYVRGIVFTSQSEEVEDEDEYGDEEHYPKKAMRDALDEVFELGGNDDESKPN